MARDREPAAVPAAPVPAPVPTPREVARLDDRAAEQAAPTGTADPARLRAGTGRHRLALGQGRPAGWGRSRHGLDLSRIRVHDDGAAARLVEAHGADAVAVGTDIAFATGRLRPGTPEGEELLDHELGHLAQQAQAGTAVLQRNGRSGSGLGDRPPREPFDTVTDVLGTEDDHILFGPDSATLPAAFEERFRGLLAQHPGAVTVELHGYASEDGDQRYNLNLSAHRAAAVGRLVEASLPPGSVVHLIAHGATTAFGDRPAENRRLGIDLADRIPASQAFGYPAPPPSPFGIPELTVDTRLLPVPGTPPASGNATTTPTTPVATPPGGAVTVVPRLTFAPIDPQAVSDALLGPNAIPPLSQYGPYASVLAGLRWSDIYRDANDRGVRLGTADADIIARHYTLYYPFAAGLYRLPGVRLFFDSPADLMNTFTRRMVAGALSGNPTPLEAFQFEIDRMRSILGLPLGVQTPTLSKTWEF